MSLPGIAEAVGVFEQVQFDLPTCFPKGALLHKSVSERGSP